MPSPALGGDLPSPILHFSALARRVPGRECVVVDQYSYSRDQIREAADALAAGLWACGVRRGDRVAIIRRNSPLHIVALLAAGRIGFTLVPLNFRLSVDEFQTILNDADCAAVLCSPRFASLFDHELQLAETTTWIVDDIDPLGETPDDDGLSFRWHYLSEIYQMGGGLVPDAVPIYFDTMALLLYTSGSTGLPKGVQLTYGNLYASWNAYANVLGTTSREVAMAIAPFSHVGGLNTFTLATLLAGGKIVVQRRWDVGEALAMIEKHRVTRMFGVPTMYDAMARHPEFAMRDLTSLKTAIVGGSACPPELLATFRQRGIPLANSWGMTELASGGTLVPPRDMETHVESIGKAIPGIRIKIMSEAGEQVPDGTVGEAWVKGACLTHGYWGIPSTPDLGFEANGWFRTGDLMKRDTDGFYTIVGRLKDLIISGGENIYPAEIERVLMLDPTVEQAVVVGAKDNRWGEIPVAFVVAPDASTEAVRLHVGNYLAKYKIPRELWIVDEIPVGATGKPDRKRLKAEAARRHDPGPRWYSR